MSISQLRRLLGTATILVPLMAGGCRPPNFRGPQIQNPPPAFTIKNEVEQTRRMFPDREVTYHAAWVEASWGNFSGIYINGHRGSTTIQEVEDARLAAIADTRDAPGERIEFGELEEIRVDGRPAWGWGEVWRLPNNGVRYVVFRAAVPYDTVTYAVDFRTGDPMLKAHPDSLRTIVSSFAIGKTEWNIPLIVIVVGLVFLLATWLQARARAQAERLRHITLVQVPKKEGAGGMSPTPAPPSAEPGVAPKATPGG